MEAIIVCSDGSDSSDEEGDDVVFVREIPPDPYTKTDHQDEVIFVRRERSKLKVEGTERKKAGGSGIQLEEVSSSDHVQAGRTGSGDDLEEVEVCSVQIPPPADDPNLKDCGSDSASLTCQASDHDDQATNNTEESLDDFVNSLVNKISNNFELPNLRETDRQDTAYPGARDTDLTLPDIIFPHSSDSSLSISKTDSVTTSTIQTLTAGVAASVSSGDDRGRANLKRSISVSSGGTSGYKAQTIPLKKRFSQNSVLNDVPISLLPNIPPYSASQIGATSNSSISDPGTSSFCDTTRGSEAPASHRCIQCHTPGLHENMSWCMLGHPCCGTCLQDQVRQLLAKSEKGSLQCVVVSCSSYYLLSQLQRTLPNMVVEILEDKLEQEYLDNASTALMQSACGQTDRQIPPLQIQSGMSLAHCQNIDSNIKEEGDLSLPDLTFDPDHADSTRSKKRVIMEGLEYPELWEDMEQDLKNGYKLVEVKVETDEYMSLCVNFHNTLPYPRAEILGIQRVQNPSLWMFYCVKKQQMMKENDGQDVLENQLFHGTKSSLVEVIAKNNFDWRMCGVNGTAFGQGSYFAKDASYSHRYTENPVHGKLGKIMPPPSLLRMIHNSHLFPQNSSAGSSNLQQVLHSFSSQNHQAAIRNHMRIPLSNPVNPALFQSLNSGPSNMSSFSSTTTQNQPSSVTITFPGGAASSSGPSQPGTVMTSLPSTSGTNQNQSFPMNLSKNPSQGGTSSQNAAPPFIRNLFGSSGNLSFTINRNTGSLDPIDYNNSETHHSMIVAKVLVGRYTQGSSKLRKPPPFDKDDPYGKSFDSCVDNVNNPNIFVIFDSAQCYPEYVIKYKMNKR